MKQYFLWLLVIFIPASCYKHGVPKNDYYAYVKVQLAASLAAGDYANLDFNRAVRTQIESKFYLRIGFKDKNLSNDFVLLSIDDRGLILKGRIIHVEGQFEYPGLFQGWISIESLQRHVLLSAPVAQGYVQRTSTLARGQSLLLPVTSLPEVIVISQYSSDADYSWGSYYNLLTFMGDSGAGGDRGHYSNADPFTDGGGSSTGGAVVPAASPVEDQAVAMESEYVYSLSGIDINKFFKCFDNIPSAGASYSIKICADIPSNNNPNASANYSTASAGHSFVTIVKSNGTASVTQSFGFYPKDFPGKTKIFTPVASELKDNGVQEINASLTMPITENQFTLVKSKAIAMSAESYDLAEYNCTHYALDVFNAARTSPLTVAGFTVYMPGTPGPYTPSNASSSITISKSPQALFMKLRDMVKQGHAEAANIKVDVSQNYKSPSSKGECN